MIYSVDISPLQNKVLSLLCAQFNAQNGTAFLVNEFFDMRALEFLNHAVGAYMEKRNNKILEQFAKQDSATQQDILTKLNVTA